MRSSSRSFSASARAYKASAVSPDWLSNANFASYSSRPRRNERARDGAARELRFQRFEPTDVVLDRGSRGWEARGERRALGRALVPTRRSCPRALRRTRRVRRGSARWRAACARPLGSRCCLSRRRSRPARWRAARGMCAVVLRAARTRGSSSNANGSATLYRDGFHCHARSSVSHQRSPKKSFSSIAQSARTAGLSVAGSMLRSAASQRSICASAAARDARIRHDEPIGVTVIADRERPIRLELPVAIEESVAELAAESGVGHRSKIVSARGSVVASPPARSRARDVARSARGRGRGGRLSRRRCPRAGARRSRGCACP